MAAKKPGNIEIHGIDPSGNEYVLNHFSHENAAAKSGGEKEVEKLRERALEMSARWQTYLPFDKIFIKEVW